MLGISDKWDSIYTKLEPGTSIAAAVLGENSYLLPKQGLALDLACGLGANALFLARQGLAVTAWDISEVAIAKLKAYAAQQSIQINACQQNITAQSLKKDSYDVIVVTRFLDRSLMNAIISAIKPNGLLFYQTFTREQAIPPETANRHIPKNPDYLLSENELLSLCSALRLIFYRENGGCGNLQLGLRQEAQLIGQKR
jgi:SAM-dependent methyltransferase